jgi:hypothetical protein
MISKFNNAEADKILVFRLKRVTNILKNCRYPAKNAMLFGLKSAGLKAGAAFIARKTTKLYGNENRKI